MSTHLGETAKTFRCSMKDATKRYNFRMEEMYRPNQGSANVHTVPVQQEGWDEYSIDTSASAIASWLRNGDTVILEDTIHSVTALLQEAEYDENLIIGDGANFEMCYLCRYEIYKDGGNAINLAVIGPMTEEEILEAVTEGWYTA